jgi:hypothetical protein
MGAERRQHKRFTATAFLNKSVHLSPVPPFFGHSVKGRLIDLSAGGLAVLIEEVIPHGTFLNLKLTFPDHSHIESIVCVRHVVPKGQSLLHGFEFLTLDSNGKERLDRMSNDFIDCESRIQSESQEICHTNCAFFSMCAKKEKINPVLDVEKDIELTFEEIRKEQIQPSNKI